MHGLPATRGFGDLPFQTLVLNPLRERRSDLYLLAFAVALAVLHWLYVTRVLVVFTSALPTISLLDCV